MDYYKDNLDPLPPRRSSHNRERDDYYDRRDRFDFDREMGSYRDTYLPSDDHYRKKPHSPYSLPPLPPPPPPPPLALPHENEVGNDYVMFGSVALELVNPFDHKPQHRLKPDPCRTIFVGSLPDTCMESHLTDLFSNCGNIVEVRVSRGRNFGHVQFATDISVDRAMKLSGCTIRIDNSHARKDVSKIHVDYAQDKQDVDMKRRIQENESLSYSSGNISVVTMDLQYQESFSYAAKNVIKWLNKGCVDEDSSASLYGLINTVSTYGHKVSKVVQAKDEAELEFKMKKKLALQKLLDTSDVMVDVFESSPGAKTWNYFTEGQRESFDRWKEQAVEIRNSLKTKIEEEVISIAEPPRKKTQTSDSRYTEADLARAMKEIEQLKTDREVAIEKKDKQILQLKTLMAKFKKTSPEEWEKALGLSGDDKTKEDSNKEEADASMSNSDDEDEVIDGVSLADLNAVMNKKASEDSLASAASAKIKTTVDSAEMAGLGLSEAEVAIVSVLAAFLTVHPLGAAIEAITAYFQTFNSDYNSYYLESLLCRLTKVFQRSGDGGGKWWFLGFQTCYAAPSAVKMEDEE